MPILVLDIGMDSHFLTACLVKPFVRLTIYFTLNNEEYGKVVMR